MSRVQSVPGFLVEGRLVQFWPIDNVPGCSHRVTIDRVAVDWLSSTARPNGRSARFFAEKHRVMPIDRRLAKTY